MKNIIPHFAGIFIVVSLLFITACSQDDAPRTDNEHLRPDSVLVIEAGKEMVTETFAAISNALGTAMTRGGIPHAIQYCNTVAIDLTDSVSTQYNVEVRRATHKPRNPNNRANEMEMASIEAYMQMISEGAELTPRLAYQENSVIYHAPLRLMTFTCLSCHGSKEEDILNEDYAIIQQYYPDDEATGFELDELRGIWSVTFPYEYFIETKETADPQGASGSTQ
ncbi:MAG: DUF3365 domain-containing protein [Cyclonatronaceae bacterium]